MLATSLVLVAALLHATWNTLIKFSGERLLVIASMDTVALAFAVLAVAFVEVPPAEIWPWLVASALAELAVIGAIVGEFVGAQAGLGYLILQRNFSMDAAGMFAILIVQAMAVGWLQRLNPVLGTLAWLAMCFLLPATQIVLVQTCSFTETLNPANAWNAVRTIGWPYLLLCLFLFLLSQGTFIALGMLLPLFKGWILLPIVNWLLIYFSWVMASLLGYAMYQNHAAFGIDLLPGAGLDDDGAPVDRRSPRQIEQDATDAHVAALITAGDMVGALGVAYEDQRTRSDEVPAQRRYHRVLTLAEGKTATLLDHAQRYIPLLLRSGQGGEALKVFQTCRAKDAQFALQDANATLNLAKAAWNANNAKDALALLQGFDRRFKNHDSVPAAYELVARVLLQGMNRADMALRVLATLESRHPDTEATRETRWLLRNHVRQGAAGG